MPAAGNARPPNRLRYLLPASIAILLALVGVVCVSQLWGDDDLFWHLSTGRWIMANGAVPSTDVLGLISGGSAWIPFEWGWDVLTYGLYRLTGTYAGIQFFTALLWGGTFFLLYRVLRTFEIPDPLAFIVLLATFLTSIDRMTPRPHSVTAFCFALLLFLYFRFRKSPATSARVLYSIPLLFVIWANLHPGVVAGISLLILILGTEYVFFLRTKASRRARGVAALDVRALRTLALVTGISAAALLVNPHGMQTYTYLYTHTQMKVLSGIDEWLPPFGAYDTFVLRCYKVLLVLAGASILYSFRTKDPLPLILYAAAAAYSLRAVRFMADFAVITAAGTALGFRALGETFDALGRLFQNSFVQLALIALMAYGVFGVVDGSLYLRLGMFRHFGTGVDRRYFSMEMVDFLRKEEIRGRVFNQLEIGGLLSWERPGEKTFIDSRNIGDTIAAEYFGIMGMRRGFDEALGTYGIDYIVLHPMNLLESRSSMQMTPIPYLTANRNVWKLVYWDDQSFVYLRNIPKFSGTIARNEYKLLHPYLYSFRRKEYDSLRIAMPELFQTELRRKQAEEPEGLIVNLLARAAR